MAQSILLQGLSLSEFESLLKKVIAEMADVAVNNKEHPPTQTKGRYLTRKEVARRLNISLPTLSKFSNNGLIPSYRIGSRVLYKEEELETVKPYPL